MMYEMFSACNEAIYVIWFYHLLYTFLLQRWTSSRGEKSTWRVTQFRRGIVALDGVATCLWIEWTISQAFLVERSSKMLCINMLTWCLVLCGCLHGNLKFRTVASLLHPLVTKLSSTPDINFPQINSQTCISNFMASFGSRRSSRLHKHIHLVCAFLSLFFHSFKHTRLEPFQWMAWE